MINENDLNRYQLTLNSSDGALTVVSYILHFAFRKSNLEPECDCRDAGGCIISSAPPYGYKCECKGHYTGNYVYIMV